MTQGRLVVMRIALFILTCALVCFGGVQGVPNVRELASRADEVVLATIVSASVSRDDTQAVPRSSVRLDALVVRSIARQMQPSQRFTMRWTQAGVASASDFPQGEAGIWFLKQNGTGSWSPVSFVSQPRGLDDVRIPTGSGPVNAVYQYRNDTPLGDKILLELLNAAELDTSNRLSYVNSGAYDEYNPAIMERFYNRLAASPALATSVNGLAGLIRIGRVDALLSVERDLPALSADTGQLAFSIAAYYRSDDAASIATLGRMAAGAAIPMAFRRAAAQALAFIHSARTVPHLATLLDSGDPDLETFATGGLAMFANGVRPIGRGGASHFSPSGAPGPYRSELTIQNFTLDVEKFKSSRASYLAFWRSWWNENREKILEAAP